LSYWPKKSNLPVSLYFIRRLSRDGCMQLSRLMSRTCLTVIR